MLEELPVYVRLKNSYNPAHYPANKKISAEEWNALWMSTVYQGNHQEDVLASILNITLPEFRLEINEIGGKYSEALLKAEEALGTSNEALDTADEAKDIALEAKDIADQALTDIGLKQNITDEGLSTVDKTIVGAINEVKTNSVAIANIINNLYSTDIDKPLSANMGNTLREMIQGQEFGRSYSNIEALVNALNEEELGAFKIPFLLLVIDLEVPDFWVAEIMETSVPYEYTTDEALIAAVKTEPLQIGYYKISISETAKVDLTNYVQRGFTIAGLNLEEDITKSALQTALDFNTLVEEAPIDNKQYVRKDASWEKSSRIENLDSSRFIDTNSSNVSIDLRPSLSQGGGSETGRLKLARNMFELSAEMIYANPNLKYRYSFKSKDDGSIEIKVEDTESLSGKGTETYSFDFTSQDNPNQVTRKFEVDLAIQEAIEDVLLGEV